MLKIENLRLPPGAGPEKLTLAAARALRVSPESVQCLEILRRSVDARENVTMIYTVRAAVERENAVLRRCRNKKIRRWEPESDYHIPFSDTRGSSDVRPVIAGAGPAGLFAAWVLALSGQEPVLLERGRAVEARRADVERFWSTGRLNLNSNVQFGEGGAGAFSDGKLNTGTRDPRHRFILKTLTAHGAPRDILIDAKPHIGTDYLYAVLQNLRKSLLKMKTDIRFETCLTDLHIENGALAGITVEGPEGAYELPCRNLILAPGHSARDTFEMLYKRGVQMEAKPFAVGVRIEHRQADCDAVQYREYAGHPGLPASSYKLSCHLPDGRSVFSFCVCPGGEVVAAASEAERLVTNGMSEFARNRENINGALLVNVKPEDFGGASPLAGVEFQRKLEASAYALGGGGYCAPVQRVEDFLQNRASDGPGRVRPSYRPGVVWTDLRKCLPPFVADALTQALPILGQKLRGFDAPDAVLTAVESRSSSPVRIPRDAAGEANIQGLFPCGEGAGYAGGILSAAADGMRCAENLLGKGASALSK